MQSILIVKTSSLGDIVHALPAVTDLHRAHPRCAIDWVVEEALADIPRLHPGVNRIITCALRRWRGRPLAPTTWREVRALRRELRRTHYDAVLDLQGLFKSAWLTRMARGRRHGYEPRSIREPLASLAYDVRHCASWQLPAVERNRLLTAAACAYTVQGAADYGLTLVEEYVAAQRAVICFHGTSRDDKLWPEANWRALLAHFARLGVRVVLPWGSATEQARSIRLAQRCITAEVPGPLPLFELAHRCAQAIGVVGVDTGLTHLAAAVGTPVIALYAGSDPALTPVVGGLAPALNLGGYHAVPDADHVIAATHALFGV